MISQRAPAAPPRPMLRATPGALGRRHTARAKPDKASAPGVSGGDRVAGRSISAALARPTSTTRLKQPRSAGARGQHDDLVADRRSLVKVDDILVDHADATGRHALADGPGLDRAVDPE